MNIIGLDLGTTTLSAIVLDGDSGAVLETVNVSNGADIAADRPFDRKQDPEVIARKALAIVHDLRAKYDIAAIGIDGQMHGILYVDVEGRAVSPLYTWQDQRGEAPMGETTYAAELSRRTGHRMATGHGMTTHFWHVVNGCVPENAATFCTVYDYVGMKLAERATPLMHISTAASVGPVDPEKGDWDREAIARAGIDLRMLPEVTARCVAIGRTPDGIPVACGIGDNQASFVGAVRDMAGAVLVNMGTGGQISMLAAGGKADGDLEIRPLEGGQGIVVGSALCGGRSYALLERFLRSCARLAGTEPAPMFEAMNRIALEMLDRDDLLSVDTRFNGTRHMPELRGAITGIGTENYDAGHLVAGTVMGMAREMRGMYDAMLEGGATPANHMIGSGNGIRRNPALRRAFEQTFGMDLKIPAHGEEAAYGAALYGMTAAGIADSLEAAQRLIRYQD